MKILIAGASGFIGQALLQRLLATTTHELVGLSRKERPSDHPRLQWIKCDLFSLKDLSRAAQGCDAAFYLVHSMLPSAALTQGEFQDLDLIIADNFARAVREHGIRRVVYLGGMIPETGKLSKHLSSRLEVESVLASTGVRFTALRAGMVIGAHGSSFVMVRRLVERLPVLVCPSWTKTPFQPIDLDDAINVLTRAIQDDTIAPGVYDIGGPTVTNYRELIRETARALGKIRLILPLDIIPLGLSRYWVTLITGAPRDLVYPLVLSLVHPMLVDESRRWPRADVDEKTSMPSALAHSVGTSDRGTFSGFVPTQRDVRSVQRLPLPRGRDAAWVTDEYFRWLPSFFRTGLKVDVSDKKHARFYAFSPRFELLTLERSLERSASDRQLLYVVGGRLAKGEGRGRLEFREALDRSCVLAAIHEFRPSLPWNLYRFTQAQVHLWVMRAFGRHLRRQVSVT